MGDDGHAFCQQKSGSGYCAQRHRPEIVLLQNMEVPCTISCPECRRTVEVSETGQVVCTNCGAPFEVGVFSPPPEPSRDLESVVLKEGELWLSGPWLRTNRRTYLLADIVGACLTRQGWTWRPIVVALFGLILFVAALGGYWQVAAGCALLVGGLLFLLRERPERFTVSWITRQGLEDRLCFPDRHAAEKVLGLLRGIGRRTSADAVRRTGPLADDPSVGPRRRPAAVSQLNGNPWPTLDFSSAAAPAERSSSVAPPAP